MAVRPAIFTIRPEDVADHRVGTVNEVGGMPKVVEMVSVRIVLYNESHSFLVRLFLLVLEASDHLSESENVTFLPSVYTVGRLGGRPVRRKFRPDGRARFSDGPPDDHRHVAVGCTVGLLFAYNALDIHFLDVVGKELLDDLFVGF